MSIQSDLYKKQEKRGFRIHVGQFREFIPFDDEIEYNFNFAFDVFYAEKLWINYIINLFDLVCIHHPAFQSNKIKYDEQERKFLLYLQEEKQSTYSYSKKKVDIKYEFQIESWNDQIGLFNILSNLTSEVFKKKGVEMRLTLDFDFFLLGITLNKTLGANLEPIQIPNHLI